MQSPTVGAVDIRGLIDGLAASARAEPLLASLIAVGAVLALLALGWGIRRLRRTPGDRFAGLLGRCEEVTVLMHPNPDPDAMSCALAVETLGRTLGTDVTMQYAGQIRHQENRAFETVLDLDFGRIDDAGDLTAEEVVLVDHNEPRGFAGAETVDPVAVVDHHPGEGGGEAFTDVRPEAGACATIFAEYFEDLGWEPAGPGADVGARELPVPTATGLIYGIQSDTGGLTKGCSNDEFEAAAFLYGGVDEDLLDRIANPEVDAEVLDVRARAITSREVRNAFACSNVGEVSNVDAIPQAADELLRLEGVTAVVVAGEKDGTVHLSGRSRDDRVHMGRTLQAAVDEIPMAEAGGHARMGGGQVSVEHMEGIGPSTGVTMPELTERIFDAMAGDI